MSTKSPRVLLVANNPVRSFVEALVLNRAGYGVDCLPDGVDAVEYAGIGQPEVVVVDIDDGAAAGAVCSRLRSHPTTNAVPIVCVAPEDAADGEPWVASALVDWIVRQYGSAALEDALAHVVGRAAIADDSVLPPVDDLLPQAADAIAANARLIAAEALRRLQAESAVESPSDPGWTGRNVADLARIALALARVARYRLPPTRMASIPRVRDLVTGYVARSHERGLRPSACVEQVQALRAEVDRFLARMVRRGGLPDTVALSLSLSVNQYVDAVVQLVVETSFQKLKAART